MHNSIYTYHYTYLITNLHPTDRCRYYIGVRSCKCLPEDDPYMGSSKYLDESISIQGMLSFEKIIISIFDTRDEASQNEIDLHNDHNVSRNPLFYNRSKATASGFNTLGTPQSVEHKRKLSLSRTGRKRSDETKARMRIAKLNMSDETKARLHHAKSDETKARMRTAALNMSDETKRKMSITRTGKRHSEEAKRNMSIASKGKKASEETRQKMSMARIAYIARRAEEIYTLINISGASFSGTRAKMVADLNLSEWQISRILNRPNYKTRSGWTLKL